jgi:ribosomal protein S18 acetylase RimI-like enzyme
VIVVRRAHAADAASIGAVHVAAWRSAYPGILPDTYLASLSAARQAAFYDRTIRSLAGWVHVATASGRDAGADGAPARVVGFVTAGPARPVRGIKPPADGEIETLYVLDDWRERGLGRKLMQAAAADLAGSGCTSAFVWVLRQNQSRWFYERLGGRVAAEAEIEVAGRPVVQTAYVWSPITRLVQAASAAP